jgi:gamma-glutamylputrescine oxidase
MSLEALDLLRERIAAHGIDCDWRDGYLGLATNARKGATWRAGPTAWSRSTATRCKRIAPADMPAAGSPARASTAAVHDPRSGHLHPLKYTLGLARRGRQPACASTSTAR